MEVRKPHEALAKVIALSGPGRAHPEHDLAGLPVDVHVERERRGPPDSQNACASQRVGLSGTGTLCGGWSPVIVRFGLEDAVLTGESTGLPRCCR